MTNSSRLKQIRAQVVALAVLLTVAILMDYFISPIIPNQRFQLIVEHISIAIIIACVIGVIFELSRDIQSATDFEEIKQDLSRDIRKLFESFTVLKMEEIFDLVREFAIWQTTYPTLYFPVRSNNEHNLKDATFFEKMVLAGREVLIEHLEKWVRPESPSNLKFLASDIIGKYQVVELQNDLLRYSRGQFSNWNHKTQEEKAWVLNYTWAASMCDRNAYEALANLLQETEFRDIQEWILFVPQQMQHDNLISMISRYIGKYKLGISDKCLEYCIVGLAEHACRHYDVSNVFSTHKKVFRSAAAQAVITREWKERGLDAKIILRTIRSSRNVSIRRLPDLKMPTSDGAAKAIGFTGEEVGPDDESRHPGS